MVTDEVRASFLTALLAPDRGACERLVADLIAAQTPIRAIYELFTGALHEVGCLWEQGQVSVASEHLATAIVETLLARVFPTSLARAPVQKSAVVSCAADEFHQLGGRIVADVLELRGWSVHFVGANTPVDALVDVVTRQRPDLLALSVSLTSHMDNVVQAIARVRAAGLAAPIVVGGQGLDDTTRPALDALGGVLTASSLAALEAMAADWERE